MKKRMITALAVLTAAVMSASALTAAAYAMEDSGQEAPDAVSGAAYSEEKPSDEKKKPEKGRGESTDAAGESETPASGRHGKPADGEADGSGKRRSGTGQHGGKKSETPEPEGAIGREAAAEAALADAGVTADGHVHARYSEEDGVSLYKVRFKSDGVKYKYRIDAFTGAVLEKTTEEAD